MDGRFGLHIGQVSGNETRLNDGRKPFGERIFETRRSIFTKGKQRRLANGFCEMPT